MPLRRQLLKRCSLPTIQEEPTPTPVISRSSPGRILYHPSHQPIPAPLPAPDRISSSLGTSSTSTWGTISPRSYLDDECAIIDDDDDEFGPSTSSEPLTFPRSPPKLPHSLSLLGLMLNGAKKELSKRPRRSPSSREASVNGDSDYNSDDVLEMRFPRGRRIRRRKTIAPLSCAQESTARFHRRRLDQSTIVIEEISFEIEETNVEVEQNNVESEEVNSDVTESTVDADEVTVGTGEGNVGAVQGNVGAVQGNVNADGGNVGAGGGNIDDDEEDFKEIEDTYYTDDDKFNPTDDKGFWEDFSDSHGGFNQHGW
ncbi:hypothetical protein F4859DRAFT_517870 [Xylaria cf. heliscus]|nr:hypothetical protein F4859DRAFT_517870 [Xylaria cf. heliscus]